MFLCFSCSAQPQHPQDTDSHPPVPVPQPQGPHSSLCVTALAPAALVASSPCQLGN